MNSPKFGNGRGMGMGSPILLYHMDNKPVDILTFPKILGRGRSTTSSFFGDQVRQPGRPNPSSSDFEALITTEHEMEEDITKISENQLSGSPKKDTSKKSEENHDTDECNEKHKKGGVVDNDLTIPRILGRGRGTTLSYFAIRQPGRSNFPSSDLEALMGYQMEEDNTKISEDQLARSKVHSPKNSKESGKMDNTNFERNEKHQLEINGTEIGGESIVANLSELQITNSELKVEKSVTTTKILESLPSTSADAQNQILSRNLTGKRFKKDVTEEFSIVKLLGEGSFGKVMQVQDNLGNYFAMKILEENDEDQEYILKEIEILVLLRELKAEQHHCIEMLMFHQSPTAMYLQFPLYGPTVKERILIKNNYGEIVARGLEVGQITEILLQLFLAINFLHGHDIVHLDIKPDNIVFTQGDWFPVNQESYKYPSVKMINPEVRLIDFGLAVIHPEDKGYNRDVCCNIYRPPEFILNTKVSYPSDIWSLGLSCIEMYRGRSLFRPSSSLEHLAQMEIVLGPFPPRLLALKRSQNYFRNKKTKRTASFKWEIIKYCRPLKELKSSFASSETNDLFEVLTMMLKLDRKERPNSDTFLELMTSF